MVGLLSQRDKNLNPGDYVGLIYRDRMRTVQDKAYVSKVYADMLAEWYPLYQPSR